MTRLAGTRIVYAKLHNRNRFHLGALDGAAIQNAYVDAVSSGERASGIGAVDFLRASWLNGTWSFHERNRRPCSRMWPADVRCS